MGEADEQKTAEQHQVKEFEFSHSAELLTYVLNTLTTLTYFFNFSANVSGITYSDVAEITAKVVTYTYIWR